MKRNLIYLTLAFLLWCVGFSSASQTNAYSLQCLNWWSCNNATAWSRNYSQGTSDSICYAWNSNYWSFYYTPSNSSSCTSPIYNSVFDYSWLAVESTNKFAVYTRCNQAWCTSEGLRDGAIVPWVSFENSWQWYNFAFMKAWVWKQTFNVWSNMWFEYNWVVYTSVIFFPNHIIFFNDNSDFLEVWAMGYFSNGFMIVNPNETTDNFFFVNPSYWKARSTTLVWSLPRDLLVWKTDMTETLFNSLNFDKSYTLTRWGASFYPNNWYKYWQSQYWGDGIIYTSDANFDPYPNQWGWDGTNGSGATISYSTDFLSCVDYYTELSNLQYYYKTCRDKWANGNLSWDNQFLLWQFNALSNYFNDPSNGYTGTWFDNYYCDATLTVIDQMYNLYSGWRDTVISDYSMIWINGNFNASTFCNGAINDNSWVSMHNMLDYLQIDGSGINTWDCEDIDNLFDRLECQLWIWEYTSNQFDSIFDKFVWLIGIVVDKFFNLIEEWFNTWYHISWDSSRLSCSNSSVEIPYIDYVQYIALFFIILFFIKLI